MNKTEQRRLIDNAVGQLLALISQKVSYDRLAEKVELAAGASATSLGARRPSVNSCSNRRVSGMGRRDPGTAAGEAHPFFVCFVYFVVITARPIPVPPVRVIPCGPRFRRLYRVEFKTFEAYCRAKWKHSRSSVDRLIAAAQLFMQLQAAIPERKPDRQTQLRSLIGLNPAEAQLAWERAAAKAGPGRITARHVKTAVAELQLGRRRAPVTRTTPATKRKRANTKPRK